jgi:hypothetical protein
LFAELDLTPEGNTEIRKCIQRRPHAPRATLIGIRSEWVIGIAWNGRSGSPECSH